MAVDGVWHMKIDSDDIDPEIVPREAKLTIKTEGSGFGGTMEGPYPMGDGVAIRRGAIKGDTATWTAEMRGERLRPQILEFSARIGETEMTGEIEVGIFGTATFVATHA